MKLACFSTGSRHHVILTSLQSRRLLYRCHSERSEESMHLNFRRYRKGHGLGRAERQRKAAFVADAKQGGTLVCPINEV